MINVSPFPGDEPVEREARALAAVGHQVTLLVKGSPGVPEREMHCKVEIIRIPVRPRGSKIRTIVQIARYLEYAYRVVRVAVRVNADVYHAHDAKTLLPSYMAARIHKAKLIYGAHELEQGRNFGPAIPTTMRRLWALPERLLIHQADAVTAASPFYAQELVRIYRIPKPVVLLNCPEEPSADALKPGLLRIQAGLSDEKSIVLYQGAIGHNRGVEQLIESLKFGEYHLALLGFGSRIGTLLDWAADLGLRERVHFLGRVPHEELLPLTAGADIGACLIQNSSPSYYYSAPNKMFEYIAAGVPVVASDFPAMRQVIQEYQVGDLVSDPSSPQEIAVVINKMLAEPERYQQMYRNARSAARVLNWENEQKKLLALYDNLEIDSDKKCKVKM